MGLLHGYVTSELACPVGVGWKDVIVPTPSLSSLPPTASAPVKKLGQEIMADRRPTLSPLTAILLRTSRRRGKHRDAEVTGVSTRGTPPDGTR